MGLSLVEERVEEIFDVTVELRVIYLLHNLQYEAQEDTAGGRHEGRCLEPLLPSPGLCLGGASLPGRV